MQVPHNSFVVVADGKKMLFFRNEGDGDYPKLEVERKRETPDAPDRDQKTDGPGRTFDASGGAGRSAYEEVDFHQLEEDRFAADTAEWRSSNSPSERDPWNSSTRSPMRSSSPSSTQTQ